MEHVTITDKEWKIMRLLWKDAPLTMPQIEGLLKEETGWKKHAVISFLKRMIGKGLIRAEEAEPARRYFPIVEQRQAVRAETSSLLGKAFGGKVSLMVSSMISENQLSDEDVQELLELLNAERGDDDD